MIVQFLMIFSIGWLLGFAAGSFNLFDNRGFRSLIGIIATLIGVVCVAVCLILIFIFGITEMWGVK